MGRAIAFLLALLWPSAAAAEDLFEIQVFHARVNDAGQPALELHSNYAGGVLFQNIEPSVGVARSWEVGLHLQHAIDAQGVAWGGARLRTMALLATDERSASTSRAATSRRASTLLVGRLRCGRSSNGQTASSTSISTRS